MSMQQTYIDIEVAVNYLLWWPFLFTFAYELLWKYVLGAYEIPDSHFFTIFTCVALISYGFLIRKLRKATQTIVEE